MSTIIPYLLAGVSLAALIRWRTKKADKTFGSAGWLPVWSASAKGLFRNRGLIAGDWTGLLPVHYDGDGHILTIAPTGRGKGTCAIIPNLLRHPFIFLCDPGGENAAIASKAWRAKGYEVQILNPWKLHSEAPWSLPSHEYNPLDILDPDADTFSSDAALIAEMIVSRGPKDGGSAAFFKDEAQNAIRAFIMHIVTTEPAERRTLITLRSFITADANVWDAVVAAMAENMAAGGLIAGEANQMIRRKEQAPEEFSAIVSTMKQDTNFLDDPVMKAALARSNADFSILKGQKAGARIPGGVVAIVIPLQYLDTHAAYARLAIAVALWEMQRAPLAREKVLFVLDEFPAMKRMDRIATGLATLRKFRVWLWPIIQDVNQLKQIYSDQWQSFLSNASFKQWLAASDLETAKQISDLCGAGTVATETRSADGKKSAGQARRPLITPDEVLIMPANRQIAMIENLKPMVLLKTPYWERAELRGLFNPNPYRAGTPPLRWTAPLRSLWGSTFRVLGWVMRPAPTLIYAAALAGLLLAEPGAKVSAGWYEQGQSIVCQYQTPLARKRIYFKWPGIRRADCPLITWRGRYYE
ncbi:type IV secretory system conjugative DNA transfer family protein [Salinarimonas rosea]|uniref:type IV secretory system conjugative DNA transfer family protein n=1 Tax=Salinarimonas rosea TaxID=552063 RepID=UPI00040F7BD2|nr:type IV secretory system conjugative DNA transfer family protein [Salinarimonas rosea]